MSPKYLLSRRYLPYAVIVLLLSMLYYIPFTGVAEYQQRSGFEIIIPLPGLTDRGSMIDNVTTFEVEKQELFMELMGVLGIASALVIAFTREKVEDEFVFELRKQSLVWAVVVHYIVFVIGLLFINGGLFLSFEHCSIINPVLFYIIRFRYV
ncbi:MAG: hypothetical protein JNL32_05275, partial [Candidatus Kapabacteria bacterium]|nr:hypothetical protein [Candidatus Kapabacteria bacterium]